MNLRQFSFRSIIIMPSLTWFYHCNSFKVCWNMITRIILKQLVIPFKFFNIFFFSVIWPAIIIVNYKVGNAKWPQFCKLFMHSMRVYHASLISNFIDDYPSLSSGSLHFFEISTKPSFRLKDVNSTSATVLQQVVIHFGCDISGFLVKWMEMKFHSLMIGFFCELWLFSCALHREFPSIFIFKSEEALYELNFYGLMCLLLFS